MIGLSVHVDPAYVLAHGANPRIDSPQVSYSPFFSNIGLVADDGFEGVDRLYLHCNRESLEVFRGFLALGCPRVACGLGGLAFEGGGRSFDLSFYAPDRFLLTGNAAVRVNVAAGSDVTESWPTHVSGSRIALRGYCATKDARDPDETIPWSLEAESVRGSLSAGSDEITLCPDENGSFSVAFIFRAVCLSDDNAVPVPAGAKEAEKASADWAESCLKDLDITVETEREAALLCRAVTGLTYNLTKAPGKLAGHVSAFPNRGGYPTHFLWDSCFQNLGLELMEPSLARESIEIYADVFRADGKFEQFICSTWARSGCCQPALMGWAASRLADLMAANGAPEEEIKAFAHKCALAFDKNNAWWYDHRQTRHGLIFCDDGLETGQDNSPRFDSGRVLAVDMNAYLYSQLRCTEKLAGIAGLDGIAAKSAALANELGEKIIEILYDPGKKLFFDADPVTAERRGLVTGSGFLPIWAGVPLGKDEAQAAVRAHLLDPGEFYGRVIFPCVSYACEEYDHGDWWRGPFWPSLGWLMLETLGKTLGEEEFLKAARRIYDMLLGDGELHELFDTSTGEGLGNRDQGWTEGIFIKLAKIFEKENLSS